MPSKSKKLDSAAIAAFEAKRDIGAEILQSNKDMKAGKGKVMVSSPTEAREAMPHEMTAPVPAQVIMADALRDGGSYVVVFKTNAGGQFSLLVPVSVDANMNAVGYGPPKLVPSGLSTSRYLDWASARTLVERVIDLVPADTPDVNLVRLGELLAVIDREGALRDAP